MDKDLIVLIVDDETDLLEMYCDYFESEGITVITAISGEEALKAYNANENIRLIISDSQMGRMSGLDLLKNLQALARPMPTFYLATGDVNKREEELKTLGVNRLVLKPFDLEEVISLVKSDLKIN